MNTSRVGQSRVGQFRVGAGAVKDRMTWEIDNTELGELKSETRTWQQLTLVLLANEQTTSNVLRPLKSHAESYEVVSRSNGGFVAEDLANGGNTFTLHAPTARNDVRNSSIYHVDKYKEVATGQQGYKYEVTLTLVASENKEPVTDYGTASASGKEWHISANAGEIATKVSSDIHNTGSEGVEGVTLNMYLTPREVRILEESASKLFSSVIKPVQDGDDYAVDKTSDNTNTIDITPPTGGDRLVDAGEYVVDEWQTTYLNESFYSVQLDILSL